MAKGKPARGKGQEATDELHAVIGFPDGKQPVYSGFTISGTVVSGYPPATPLPSVQCYLAALLERLCPAPTAHRVVPSSVQCWLEDANGNEIGGAGDQEYWVDIPSAIVTGNTWNTTCTTNYTGACTLKAQLNLPTGQTSGSVYSVPITIDE
jgi:hypothetical protein